MPDFKFGHECRCQVCGETMEAEVNTLRAALAGAMALMEERDLCNGCRGVDCEACPLSIARVVLEGEVGK